MGDTIKERMIERTMFHVVMLGAPPKPPMIIQMLLHQDKVPLARRLDFQRKLAVAMRKYA